MNWKILQIILKRDILTIDIETKGNSMGFLFGNNNRPGGLIAYFNLSDWWLNEFTEEERKFIVKTYGIKLIKGKILETTSSKLSFLGTLASWFDKKDYRNIAIKIIEEGEKYFKEDEDVMDLHFFCLNALRIYYANRNVDTKSLDKAIYYCEIQVSLAEKFKKAWQKQYRGSTLPSHTGYHQLSIIYEKQHRYEEALLLMRKALKQGWNVEESKKRIERLEKLLAKL